MYGMVNKAVFDMVHAYFGADTWKAISRRAGIEDDMFLSMRQYPDQVTYRLVAAASQELSLSPEAVLEAFGEYWVSFTAREGYGELLKLQGSTLLEFLSNLDAMHARVGLSFSNLQPPAFHLTEQEERSVKLHYSSTRQGLAHLVVGLLRGLGKMFATTVDVTILPRQPEQAETEIFLLRW
jgi:hypothetical protein